MWVAAGIVLIRNYVVVPTWLYFYCRFWRDIRWLPGPDEHNCRVEARKIPAAALASISSIFLSLSFSIINENGCLNLFVWFMVCYVDKCAIVISLSCYLFSCLNYSDAIVMIVQNSCLLQVHMLEFMW